VIVSNKEVENGITGVASHGLNDLLGVRRETCIADRDSVEGLEVMHIAEHAALLLDAKPAGAI